jgi:UDP-N-acetylmuramoyl-tripeptide--D-alanyl-D-alanine ligase
LRKRLLSEIASALDGRLRGPDASADSVSIDSRSIERDGLFFALAGEHVDGHLYVADAIARGA